jgi:hypothetical protein
MDDGTFKKVVGNLGQSARQIRNAGGIVGEVERPHGIAMSILMLVDPIPVYKRLQIRQHQSPAVIFFNSNSIHKHVIGSRVNRNAAAVILLHTGQIDHKQHKIPVGIGLLEVDREIIPIKCHLGVRKQRGQAVLEGGNELDDLHLWIGLVRFSLFKPIKPI